MGRRGTLGGLAICLGLLLGAAPGMCGEEARFLATLEACQKHVRSRRYSTALGLYRKLLRTHEGCDYVRRRVAAIEDDLKICSFHRGYREPKTRALLGPAVTEFKRQRREITFSYDTAGSAAVGLDWKKEGAITFLKHVFEGDLSIEHPPTPAVLFYYNTDEGSGYAVMYEKREARQTPSEWTPVVENLALVLYRHDSGVRTRLHDGQFTQSRFPGTEDNSVYCRRKNVSATAKRDSVLHGTTARVSAYDEDRYRTGRIGIVGTGAGVRVHGYLDKGYLTQLSRQAEARAYAAWCETSYDRKDVIPAWLREKVEPNTRLGLPADAPAARRKAILDLLRSWHDGEAGDLGKAVRALEETDPLPPNTRRYLGALASLDVGEVREALGAVTGLIEAQEGFGPAYALRGFLRLRLRREEGLREDLARAKELAPNDPLTVLLEANAAMVDGDIEHADDVLAAAVLRGVQTKRIEAQAHAIHRSNYGPAWTRRFRKETHQFVLESDHSHDTSSDVATRLGIAYGAYRRLFPGRPRTKLKSRVRVFTTEADYIAYGRDLGSSFRGSAGVYLPHVRELVLFYRSGEKETFDRIVRHEGFHWYVHGIVDVLPIWFNEGHAMCFETAPRPGAPPDPLLPNALRVLELSSLRRKHNRMPMVNARNLMLMDPAAFMANASCHYAHAWALVHMLRATKNPDLEKTLDTYFDAIRNGQSQEEAYRVVYAGCIDAVERAYTAHLWTLLAERIRPR